MAKNPRICRKHGSAVLRECLACKEESRIEKYGLSRDDFTALVMKSKGACMICREPYEFVEEKVTTAIDHDHLTGKVRGILCRKCNTGLGMFKDNPDILVAAANYLIEARRQN